MQPARDALEKAYNSILQAPVTGTILSPGFYNIMFLVLGVYTLFIKKQKKYTSIYMVMFSMLLICIASPYVAIRYMLVTVYALPTLITTSIYINKNDK